MLRYTKLPFRILLVSFIFWEISKSEVYTALADLKPLIYTEREIVKSLEKYLEIEEERLDSVRRLRKQYENLYEAAIGDVGSFLSNPVNAYLLVKRLTKDWENAEQLLLEPIGEGVMKNINLQDLKFPDDEDLEGAASALMRLQDTYLLDTTELASGKIEGTNMSSELKTGDCFELGYQAFNQQDYYHTFIWMKEALHRLEFEEPKTVDKSTILLYLANATSSLGNNRHALKLTQDIIREEPNHPTANENLKYYEEQVRIHENSNGTDEDYDNNEWNNIILHQDEPYEGYEVYQKLCRGEQMRSAAEESKLYCHYTTRKSIYLLLQPVKEEILSFSPWIVMYHDVISDKDVNFLKRLAHPQLTRVGTVNYETGLADYTSYRISKSAFFPDNLHPRVAHSSRIIGEITGLSMMTAERIHITNYGIGGHYEPHYDFKLPEEADGIDAEVSGNRIATWMYYLSDVNSGGATVFPDIGVHVKPKKGSAVFWYNLKKNGDGELDTYHAGCPVLIGTKWIGNKWLHEHEQEFRRPCSLDSFE